MLPSSAPDSALDKQQPSGGEGDLPIAQKEENGHDIEDVERDAQDSGQSLTSVESPEGNVDRSSADVSHAGHLPGNVASIRSFKAQPSGHFDTVDLGDGAKAETSSKEAQIDKDEAKNEHAGAPVHIPEEEGLRRQWVQQQKQSGHAGKDGTWGLEQTSLFKSAAPLAEQVGKQFERLATYVEEKVVGSSSGGGTGLSTDVPSAPPTPTASSPSGEKSHPPAPSPVSVLNATLGRFTRAASMTFAGGAEAYWRQKFSPPGDEKLLSDFACSLMTQLGALTGVLFLTTRHVAFCSDWTVPHQTDKGEVIYELYKAVIPVDDVKQVTNVGSEAAPADRYLKLATAEKEWYFNEFANYEKACADVVLAFSPAGVVASPRAAKSARPEQAKTEESVEPPAISKEKQTQQVAASS